MSKVSGSEPFEHDVKALEGARRCRGARRGATVNRL